MRAARMPLAAALPAVIALVAVGPGRTAAAPAAAPTVTPSAAPAFAADAPDPDVVRIGSTYYAYTTGTTWGNYIGVLTSSSPTTGWRTRTGQSYGSTAMGTLPPWEQADTQTSPGVFAWGGRYVMFYDAFDAALGHYCLSVATSGSPLGPFQDGSAGPLLCQTDLGGSVDPAPFVDAAGRPWLDWKSNDGSSSQPAYLWAAPLAAGGTTLAAAPTQLLAQDTVAHPWETTVENPDMVLVGATYYLFFAGGRWDSSSYAEGYAVCDGPAGPCTQPQAGPILASSGNVAGPGAATVFSDDGGRTYLAYAAWTAPCTSYSCGGARQLYVAPLTFGAGCAPPAAPAGYRFVAADGGIFDFGNLPFCGSAAGGLAAPAVGMAATTDGGGYWVAASDGTVVAFGDAGWHGDASGLHLAAPVVGIAPTADGGGYWLAAADGGVFAFGDAAWYGSMGGTRLAAPIVGAAADPATGGYWLVASDGGVFTFHAPFFGSAGAIRLAQPVVGMAATPAGTGYWLVASDGGIFTYGDAGFHGSTGAIRLNRPVVGMARTATGGGYRLVASDGGVFCFGDAAFYGSTGGMTLARPVVGTAA